MHTKEEKSTCHLPIADYDIEVKLYIHSESGDSVNMGPFVELAYDSVMTREENRNELDLDFQRAISFINDSAFYMKSNFALHQRILRSELKSLGNTINVSSVGKWKHPAK